MRPPSLGRKKRVVSNRDQVFEPKEWINFHMWSRFRNLFHSRISLTIWRVKRCLARRHTVANPNSALTSSGFFSKSPSWGGRIGTWRENSAWVAILAWEPIPVHDTHRAWPTMESETMRKKNPWSYQNRRESSACTTRPFINCRHFQKPAVFTMKYTLWCRANVELRLHVLNMG